MDPDPLAWWTSPPTKAETSTAGFMQTRDLKEAADLLVEASELLARSG
jgi:hypothetical protein